MLMNLSVQISLCRAMVFFSKDDIGRKDKCFTIQSSALPFVAFQRPTEEKYNFTEKPHNKHSIILAFIKKLSYENLIEH